MPIIEGICPRCKELKKYTFPFHVLKKMPRCETCNREVIAEQRKKRYKKNKEKFLNYQKNYRERKKTIEAR